MERPIRQWGGGGVGRQEEGRGGHGWLIAAVGLMDVWALNWLQMTAEAVFQSLIHRFLALLSSLAPPPTPPPIVPKLLKISI